MADTYFETSKCQPEPFPGFAEQKESLHPFFFSLFTLINSLSIAQLRIIRSFAINSN